MSTKLQTKENFGIPVSLGAQLPSANMDTRPRIRRRIPNIQSPLTVPHKSHFTPTPPFQTSSHPSSPIRAVRPVRPGVRPQKHPEPFKAIQRKTSASKQKPSRPGSGTSNIDLDFEYGDEGQDVKFFDVGSTAGSVEQSTSRTARTPRDVQRISCQQILDRCQERECQKVYQIDLHGEQLAGIENLDSFTKLRVLDLSCNYINQIDNLQSNTDIRELKLYDNDIELVENLDKLKELCHLQLQHNRLKAIGKGLQNQRKLHILRLDSNILCRLEVRELASCGQLTSLDISNNKIDSIAAVSCLTNLEELYAVNNRLRTVADLSRCKKLQEIDISYNKLSDLSGLKSLSHLTILHASNNNIASMKSLGKLKGLQELNVACNRLTELKSLVDFYPALQILDISDNHIETWPEVCLLQNLQDLVELYINGNPFCSQNGQKPSYHTELQKLVSKLEILDGAHLKKASSKPGTPLMRPMSANSVLTSRQVEMQLKTLDDEMFSFEKNLSDRFESLRSTMEYLPTEAPSRPASQATSVTRPSSSTGKRSRIKLAQEYASQQHVPVTKEEPR